MRGDERVGLVTKFENSSNAGPISKLALPFDEGSKPGMSLLVYMQLMN